MYEEMVSSLWQTLQECAPAERIGGGRGGRNRRGVVFGKAGFWWLLGSESHWTPSSSSGPPEVGRVSYQMP